MLNEVMISRANFDDLNDILNLQKTAFLVIAELYDCYDIEPLNQSLESIQHDFSHYLFLKAEYHGEIIGSVRIRKYEDVCWIGKLIVSPQFQNKGIGHKLMTESEKIFPDVKRYELFTAGKSIKNIRFYESLGYKITGSVPEAKVPEIILVQMIKDMNK